MPTKNFGLKDRVTYVGVQKTIVELVVFGSLFIFLDTDVCWRTLRVEKKLHAKTAENKFWKFNEKFSAE